MNDLQSRLIGPCARVEVVSAESFTAELDHDSFLKRLILFDTFLLQTIRFKEFVSLVRAIGVDKTIVLLESGALKLVADVSQICSVGQTEGFPSLRNKPPLPFGAFAFSRITAADQGVYISNCLSDLQKELSELSLKQAVKLKRALADILLPVPVDSAKKALVSLIADLRANTPVAQAALLLKLKKERGIEVFEDQLPLRIVPIGETDFVAECDLSKVGITEPQAAHKLLEAALLAVGGVNTRLEEMDEYNALSSSIEDELPLFEGKLSFLARFLSANAVEFEFERILKISALPSFELSPLDQSFDVDQFLKVRSSKECTEFRAFVRRSAQLNEKDLHEHLNSVRARLGSFLQSSTGKLWRFGISTAVGVLPFGNIAGPALGVVDSFVVERIFPTSGPLVFLHRLYRTLLDKG